MVCQKCEKKLANLANPDVWRDGGKNNTTGYGKDGGGRKIGENMLLKNMKHGRAAPFIKKCRGCKKSMHQEGQYCSACAHQQGLCAICGKKMVDVSAFRMDLGNQFNESQKERQRLKEKAEKEAPKEEIDQR